MSEADRVEAAFLFADTRWSIETRLTFEPVDGLDIETPPATDDDRTADWVDFLSSAGVLDD